MACAVVNTHFDRTARSFGRGAWATAPPYSVAIIVCALSNESTMNQPLTIHANINCRISAHSALVTGETKDSSPGS